jgi:hypothetical protein
MKNDGFYETLIKIQTRIVKRWEVLRRDKCYQDDRRVAYEAFLSRVIPEDREANSPDTNALFYTSPEGLEVAHKYNLMLPFDPEDDLGFEGWGTGKEYTISLGVFADESAIDIIPHFAVPVSVHDRGPTRDSSILRDNRFLFLAIDLQKPKQEIMMEFERHLEAYLSKISDNKGIVTKHGKRGRGTATDFYLETDIGKVSIFKIWDMNKKGLKSPWKITQELFPEVIGTSYQPYSSNYKPETRAVWSKIKNAIKRVDGQRSQFSPTI